MGIHEVGQWRALLKFVSTFQFRLHPDTNIEHYINNYVHFCLHVPGNFIITYWSGKL